MAALRDPSIYGQFVPPEYTARVADYAERKQVTFDELNRLTPSELRALKHELTRRGLAIEERMYDQVYNFRPDRNGRVVFPNTPVHTFCVAQANEPIDLTYREIDLQQVCDAIQTHCRELVEYWNTDADFILMGEEEFAALCNIPYAHQIIGFEVKFNRNGTLMGIPFRVTPTITGWCIVPKVK